MGGGGSREHLLPQAQALQGAIWPLRRRRVQELLPALEAALLRAEGALGGLQRRPIFQYTNWETL